MCSLNIVRTDPDVKVGLEFLKRSVHHLSEGYLIQLIEDDFVEALADNVGLR